MRAWAPRDWGSSSPQISIPRKSMSPTKIQSRFKCAQERVEGGTGKRWPNGWLGGLNWCNMPTFFPLSSLFTEATNSGSGAASSALVENCCLGFYGWEGREGHWQINKHDSTNWNCAQKIRGFFFEGWKTAFISSAATTERGPWVFSSLFGSAQNLLKKKKKSLQALPQPRGR